MQQKTLSYKTRLCPVLALLLAALLMLGACGAAPTADELRPTVERLVTESLVLNDILYGDGFATHKTVTGTDYDYVDEEDLAARLASLSGDCPTDENGIPNPPLTRLRAACAAVFTPDICAAVNETVFVGITDALVTVLPRFVEDENGYLMQDRAAASILPGVRAFAFDAMTVVKASKTRVELAIPSCTDGVADAAPTRVVLRAVDGGWRLDSMTY